MQDIKILLYQIVHSATFNITVLELKEMSNKLKFNFFTCRPSSKIKCPERTVYYMFIKVNFLDMIEIKCMIPTVHNYVGLSVHNPLLSLFFKRD